MKLELIDFEGNKTEFDLYEDLDKISSIMLLVITGDEIAEVIYENGMVDEYDSSNCRTGDYYDGSYLIYHKSSGINLLEDPKFLGRKDSYEYLYGIRFPDEA